MKRLLIFAAAIILAAIVGCLILIVQKPQKGHLDAGKITAAMHAYSSKMKSEEQPLPPTIPLQELVARGFLKHEDVSAFDGMEVTVYLTVDDTNSQAVLMRVQLPDGNQVVALTDGSIQQVAK